MTVLEKEIRKLPKAEKISLMEQIWADLSSDSDSLEMPEWHASELEATAERLQQGEERFEDWSEVKRKLRDE